MTNCDYLWKLPPADLVLSSNDVHVWRAGLDQSAVCVRDLAQTLSVDELNRSERFYFERDQKRFIIGRGLLRTILSRYLNTKPSQLQFCYSPYGKPALSQTFSKSKLCFNLSHSQGLALYAVTCQRAIGVDLEQIRPVTQMEQIAKYLFSVQENLIFLALPQNQKQVAFFNCWTRKEAYLKAIGEGLAFPLNQLDVSLSPSEPAQLYAIKGDRAAAADWTLQELIPASSYVAAIAVEGRDRHFNYWQWHAH